MRQTDDRMDRLEKLSSRDRLPLKQHQLRRLHSFYKFWNVRVGFGAKTSGDVATNKIGCGSVGRAVDSDTRGLRFESSHWQWLWLSWQSGRFRFQRSAIRIQSLAVVVSQLAERSIPIPEACDSNPVIAVAVAQLVERLIPIPQVYDSNPVIVQWLWLNWLIPIPEVCGSNPGPTTYIIGHLGTLPLVCPTYYLSSGICHESRCLGVSKEF